MHHYPIFMLINTVCEAIFMHLVLIYTLFLQKNADFKDNSFENDVAMAPWAVFST